MSRGVRLVAVGLDHATAGIELRERLSFAEDEIPPVLGRLTGGSDPLLEQAAILSTCNRVELYGAARWSPDERRLTSFLALYHGLDTSVLARAVSVDHDFHVALRLAATAAGLRSLVIGEAQIQGQVRKALQYALTAGTAGVELRRLFEVAIAAGRRVRSRTGIGSGAASIPYAGVELARRRLGTLSWATVLVIGTGTVGELAAKQLVKRGAARLLILGRNGPNANSLAESYGAHAITPERLEDALAQSDVVICATGAPQLLHREQLRLAVARRGLRSTPLLLIDLSVPRGVDPTAAELPGVELHTIDDLRGSIESALVQRRAAVPEAYAIVAAETERFGAWLRRREADTSGSGTASLGRNYQTGRAPRSLPGAQVATH